jgi:carbonic anhydrase
VLYNVVTQNSERPINPGFKEAMELLVNLPANGDSDTKVLASSVDFDKFLPTNRDFWHYRGSMTTPGCNENVTWFVLQEPVNMIWHHYVKMRDAIIYPELGNSNARAPLALNNRQVLASNFQAKQEINTMMKKENQGADCLQPVKTHVIETKQKSSFF